MANSNRPRTNPTKFSLVKRTVDDLIENFRDTFSQDGFFNITRYLEKTARILIY